MTQVREPDQTNVKLDPNTCEVMEGIQHEALDVEALADSIATLGQLNPVQIIEHADGRRLIAAGRRRWMACKSRNLPLIANIWMCPEEDINLELFARAVRIAENVERCDPSAMDVANQMLAIRSEHRFKNARELAEHLHMSESSVKKYMSLCRASESLQEMAAQYSLTLGVVMELAQCEKTLGRPAAKKLAMRVVKGEIGLSDLSKLRGKTSAAKPSRKRTPAAMLSIRVLGESLLKRCATASADELSELDGFLAQIRQYLPGAKAGGKTNAAISSGAERTR